MADNRFSPWKEDNLLKDALKTYVKQGLQRKEAIYFLRKKIRQKNDLVATRDQVYNVMSDLDSEGLAALGRVGAKARRKKVNFSSMGPKWVHSLDGHDKSMGFQTSTFSAGYLWLLGDING